MLPCLTSMSSYPMAGTIIYAFNYSHCFLKTKGDPYHLYWGKIFRRIHHQIVLLLDQGSIFVCFYYLSIITQQKFSEQDQLFHWLILKTISSFYWFILNWDQGLIYLLHFGQQISLQLIYLLHHVIFRETWNRRQ